MTVVEFPRKRGPDPACTKCGGKGWYAVRYRAPGSAMDQGTVRVCGCMKKEEGGRDDEAANGGGDNAEG